MPGLQRTETADEILEKLGLSVIIKHFRLKR